MKRHVFSNAAVKAIVLKIRYPNSNHEYLMKYTTLVCNVLDDAITMATNLSEDHWAFTQKKPPLLLRYQMRENGEDVFDSATGETLGYFNTKEGGEDYAAFLNDRLKD